MFGIQNNQRTGNHSLRLILLAGLFGLFQLTSVQAHTLHVTDDVYVDMVDIDTNFGSNPNLVVQNVSISNRSGANQAYMNFSLTTLPNVINGTDIEKATLRIWVDKVNTPGLVKLHLVNASWDENLLTGATIPSTGYIASLNIMYSLGRTKLSH